MASQSSIEGGAGNGAAGRRAEGLSARFRNMSLAAKLSLVLTGIMLAMSAALSFALSAYLTKTLEARSMSELKKTNLVVVDMIDAYNSSLEQAAERLGNLFTSYFPERFSLDGSATMPAGERSAPILRSGKTTLNLRFAEVDRFTAISGGNATVFARLGDDFVRIATSVRKEDGERATGTVLGKAHPGYSLIAAGQPYVGKAHLFGKDYMTKYMPIKDDAGTVIGILYIGVDFTAGLKGLKEKIRNIKLGETGYVYIVDAGKDQGMLVVHPVMEGKNLLDARDAEGNAFIRTMIEAKDGLIHYPWMNAALGETSLRGKVAVFNQYPAWDWLVVSGGYLDEFTAESRHLRNILIAALIGFAVVLVAVIRISSRVWVGRPLELAVGDIERLAGGDLSPPRHERRDGHDEIGRLLTAMDRMRLSLGDMIETIRANAELEAVNQRLRNLDQLKSDFLSSVSHELRTPLTSIRGFSQLIEREFTRSFAPLAGDDPKLQKKSVRIEENLKVILKESERLTRLINDVLDLAKIEAGRTEWHDATLDVAAFVQEAAQAVHGLFQQKPDVELRLDIQPGLPPFIGDADRMLQVLVNLINNAVKFTDRGAITVRGFLNPEKRIQLEVHDTGTGFPPEEAESIFDKFQQARQGDTLVDRPKGTGLGLAICREIVNRHGGRIWATSTPGQGSVFALTLPPAAGRPAEAAAPAARLAHGVQRDEAVGEAARNSRVLVVDDDPAVRGYFTQLLQEQGYEVVTAADGEAAIAAARDCRPDLITMDLAMPVMDGRTAIHRLRADPELKRIPIMVISAIPGLETAGGDVAMSKPLDEPQFMENLHALLDAPHAAGTQRQLRFLVLYEEGRPPVPMPEDFHARCEVGFCSIGELPARVQAGFQGMVAIPADLLSRVDIDMLNVAPALEIMIVPAWTGRPPPAGAAGQAQDVGQQRGEFS